LRKFAGIKFARIIKLARTLSVFALLLFFSSFAHSQQFDVAIGGGTLFSTKNITASEAYLPPSEKGGVYPSVSIERIFQNHYGYSAELAYRYDQGFYNNYQHFRPVMYDLNAVYAPRLGKKMTADLTGGVGGETVLFYPATGNCNYVGCSTHLDSNHFLFHAGAGIRYALWRRVFVRPEANYYRIVNNTVEFHSDNVLRLGASIGITFHRD
jgi:opacity protein-like surface antigen